MLEKLRNLLRDDISEYLHKYIHYDAKACIALVYTQKEKAAELIAAHIRDTDKAITVSPHLHVVIFQYTNTENEVKAAVANLEERVKDQKHSMIAYTVFHETDKESDTVVTRLYRVFEDLFVHGKEFVESDREYFEKFLKNHVLLDTL
jgi:hypothetical protein